MKRTFNKWDALYGAYFREPVLFAQNFRRRVGYQSAGRVVGDAYTVYGVFAAQDVFSPPLVVRRWAWRASAVGGRVPLGPVQEDQSRVMILWRYSAPETSWERLAQRTRKVQTGRARFDYKASVTAGGYKPLADWDYARFQAFFARLKETLTFEPLIDWLCEEYPWAADLIQGAPVLPDPTSTEKVNKWLDETF